MSSDVGDTADRANRLKQARAFRGFEAAKEAAEAMSTPYGTYSGHESSSRGMKHSTVVRYANFFRINPAWLWEGIGNMIEGLNRPCVPVAGSIVRDGTVAYFPALQAIVNAPAMVDEKKSAKVPEKALRDAAKKARRKEVGARIRALRELRRLNPAQLARKFVPPLKRQAIHNWEAGRASPLGHNMQQLADLLDTTSRWLEQGKGDPPTLPGQVPTVSVPITGEAGEGMGIDRLHWPENQWYYVRMEVPRGVQNDDLHGRRVAGSSMDLVYPEGTVVICAPHREGDNLVDGRRYIVKRHRRDAKAELVVRELKWHTNGWWLWPRSSHDDYQLPTKLHPLPEGEALEVAFRIVARSNIEP